MGSAPKSAPEKQSRRRFVSALAAVLVLFAVIIGAVLYLTGESFRSYVQTRVVMQLEQITGGRVELGRLTWTLYRLQVEADNLTIHGLESPDQVPYAHVDRMLLQLKIFSLLEQDLGIRALELDRPVFHLIVYPDGHTNQPVPQKARITAKPDIQQLFHLELDRAEVLDGMLIINQRRIPLDLNASGVAAEMSYVGRDQYQGKVRVGGIAVKYRDFVPTQVSAELEFSLNPDQFRVKSAKLSTSKSTVAFSGQLMKFADPTIETNFEAALNLAELGPTTRHPEVRDGAATVRGTVQYSAGNYASIGKVTARGVQYRDRKLSLRDADVAADYSLDPQRIALRNLVAHVFAGTVRGDSVVDNWLAETPAKPATKNAKSLAVEQAGSAQFRLENVSVSKLMEGVSRPSLQLSRLNSAGAINGTVDLRWRRNITAAVVGMDVSVSPPAGAAGGKLPLSASVRGTYELATDRLNLTRFSASLPDVQASGTGSLGRHNEQLNVTVAVEDLSKLEPILMALGQPIPAVNDVTGKGTFRGTVSRAGDSVAANGHVDLLDVSVPLSLIQQKPAVLMPVTSGSEPVTGERVQLDSLAADIQYSTRNLVVHNGVTWHQQSKANFDFSAQLTEGALTPASEISGHVSLHDEDIAELQKVIGYAYPLQGRISATLQVRGTKESPEGTGHIQVNDAEIHGESVKEIVGEVSFSPTRITASHLSVVQNGGHASASGYYDLKSSEFQFIASGDDIELAQIHHLQTPKMHVAGKVTFKAEGTGTTHEPVINGSVQAAKLVLNGQSIGSIRLDAETRGDTLALTGHSSFERAQVDVSGTVRLRGDFPAELKADFAEFNIAPFVPNHPEITTRMAGTVAANGRVRDLNSFNAVLEISQFSSSVHGIRLTNSGPIRLGIDTQQLRVERLRVQGEDTELTATGTVGLTGRKALKLSANGHMSLRLAQMLDPDLVTSGSVTLNLDIAGTWTRPRMLGQVTIANGAIALIDLPNGLSNINGTLIFDQDQLSVQSMTARTGGGNINVGGYITYRDELAFNLTAAGKDIRLRYPQGVSSSADVDLRLSGNLKNSNLSGDVTVTRFGITPQFDLALYLARSKMAPQAPNPDSPAYSLHLDMHVVSTPELQVQTTVGRLAGDVDLRVRGTAAKPVVLGRINITEGQIAFNGTNYELRRGDITFTNPVGIVPVLNIEAGTRIRNYDITLSFHGDVNRLVTNYRSDPPLPEGDVISLLAFGRTREETDLSSSNGLALNGTVSNALLGEALNTAVGDRVQKLFGVSRIKISPDYATTTTNPTAQVTIEQQVSKKITVTYITSLAQTTYSQQAVQVEYQVNRNVSVVGGRDLYGILSFDVKIRQRKQ